MLIVFVLRKIIHQTVSKPIEGEKNKKKYRS
jgi:hypothetical protein